MRIVIAAQPPTVNPLLFPAEKSGDVIRTWGKLAAQLREDSGVTFTPHDLRRTCRMLMSRLGVEHDIAELAIGHQRTGLDRRYNFDEAWELRCAAFTKISNHITALLDLAQRRGSRHHPGTDLKLHGRRR
jgi:integrase